MKRFLLLSSTLLTLLVSACSSVPMATTESDSQAKNFVPKKNLAYLYVYRNEFIDLAPKITLALDGEEVGQTIAKSYLAIPLYPGKHQLVSKTDPEQVLDLVLVAGKSYYINQQINAGFPFLKTKLEMVDQVIGEDAVEKSRLIDSPYSIAAAHPLGLKGKENHDQEIQRAEFRSGVSSYTVERLAKTRNCIGSASLLTKPGPVEIYRVNCEQGATYMARCELRQCAEMERSAAQASQTAQSDGQSN